ncbi:hypothetical protein HAX54_034069 [Datura stramonium]|uniref:Uncharacterized protein n=1 Tax=Datura stramonium TaxID=4076 RepID=A0ABS8SE04_DATST|nr:hypothetical protein [Datura stramonium]
MGEEAKLQYGHRKLYSKTSELELHYAYNKSTVKESQYTTTNILPTEKAHLVYISTSRLVELDGSHLYQKMYAINGTRDMSIGLSSFPWCHFLAVDKHSSSSQDTFLRSQVPLILTLANTGRAASTSKVQTSFSAQPPVTFLPQPQTSVQQLPF